MQPCVEAYVHCAMQFRMSAHSLSSEMQIDSRLQTQLASWIQLLHRYKTTSPTFTPRYSRSSGSFKTNSAISTYDNAVVPLVRLQMVAVHDHHTRGRHCTAVAAESLQAAITSSPTKNNHQPFLLPYKSSIIIIRLTSRHKQPLGQLDSPQLPERTQGTMPSM